MADQQEVAAYEKELAGYLQERIKPGLNRGAIPLLARSLAKELAHRQPPNGASADAEDEEQQDERAESDDEPTAEAEDEQESEDEGDDEGEEQEEGQAEAEAEGEDDAEAQSPADFESEMHQLQSELGEDWILRFSVQGDDAWLTAEKDDGSQRVEAQTAEVLSQAIELINEGGGRSG